MTDPEIEEFIKKYGEQKPKGYLTAKDLEQIKEFMERDGDIKIEWKFEKKETKK